MSQNDFIREIFARIEREPERSREALRAKIVRQLRGEVPRKAPYHGERGEEMSLEDMAERGRQAIAMRRQKRMEERYARWAALRKLIEEDIEAELRPHLPRLIEPPGDDFILTFNIPNYAPIKALYSWHQGEWKRLEWKPMRIWAVVPRPFAPKSHWEFFDSLDEALAIAAELHPAHLPAKPREKGFVRRLALLIGTWLFT